MTDPRRPFVIAIHGVGNPSPGEITSAVANNLSAGGIDAQVSEFNWNQHVEYPTDMETGGLRFFAFEEVAACSAYLGRLSSAWDAGSGERMPVYERLFLLAQLMFGLAIALLFFLPLPAIYTSLATLVIEPSLSLGWIWDLAGGLVVAALASLALFLASGAIRTLSGRGEFRSTIRRGLLLILHPFLLMLLLPLLLWSGLIRKLEAKQFLAPIGFGLLAIVFWLLPVKAGGVIALLVGIYPAMFLTSWALGLLGQIVFGPVIKVILDVIRYAGDSRYRHQLLEEFDEHVSRETQNSTEPRQCILLAHSLGSIIAIDSLLHGRSWHADSDVVLVTMGSPLRRLFFAFLPGHLLPRTVSRIHTLISSRVVRFRWLNVFRPWDQIGTSLGLNRNAVGRDVSTRQCRKVLSAHTDYWSDGVVRDEIVDAIQRPQIAVTVDHAGAAAPEVQPPLSTSPWTGLLSALDSGRAMVLLVLLVIGSSVALFSVSLWTARTTAKEVRTLLDDSGVRVANARVEYWKSDFVMDSQFGSAWNVNLIFRFEADDASRKILIKTRTLKTDLPHRLIDIARLDREIQRERSPNENQHVDYAPIVLRYVPRWQNFINLPEGQAALDLPDYPPSKGGLLFADLLWGFLAFLFALMVCFVIVPVYKYLFVRWLGLLLGVRTGNLGDPL